MSRVLRERDVEAAIRGGSVYACGGGGWVEHGRMLGLAAVNAGEPELVSVDELPDDAIVATAAAIGAPAGSTPWQMLGVDYVNAVRLVEKELGRRIDALMVGQNGKSSTMNGWLPAAILGTKVLDAVGDLRAHPTGDMGSIGLANSPLRMIQSAVGGNRADNAYIELTVTGSTAKISPILRKAADMAGGFIASCRNPIPNSYVRKHAVLGGISMALALGEAILAAEAFGGDIVDAICTVARGEIIGAGRVKERNVVYTRDAFDIGTITIGTRKDKRVVHVMNEHMAVDGPDGRLATYPDVIVTLAPDGQPLSVGEIKVGDEIRIMRVPKDRIPLSSSVLDPTVYPVVEAAMGIPIADYALGRL